jgi:quercetin dioxygenase-like cupin family protein
MNQVATAKDPIALGGMTIQFLVEADESGGSVSVFRCDLPVDSALPVPHSHDAFEETIYGLEGEITWTVDGVPTALRRGDVLVIPRGAVHGFAVSGNEDASMLCIATPGLLGADYFRDIAGVLATDGPPDVGALIAVMKRHGLTPAPPPQS